MIDRFTDGREYNLRLEFKRRVITPASIKQQLSKLMRLSYHDLVMTGPHDIGLEYPLEFVTDDFMSGYQDGMKLGAMDERIGLEELREPSFLIHHKDDDHEAFIVLYQKPTEQVYLAYMCWDNSLGMLINSREYEQTFHPVDDLGGLGLMAEQDFDGRHISINGATLGVNTYAECAVDFASKKTPVSIPPVVGMPTGRLEGMDHEMFIAQCKLLLDTGTVRGLVLSPVND